MTCWRLSRSQIVVSRTSRRTSTWCCLLSSARPLFGQVVPSFPNGLWSRAKFIFPNLGGNLIITLNYLLTFSSARHACYLTLRNQEDHRGIKKIVEVKGRHVSLFPLPTLGISWRDSCKGGRIVTAQIWYPKIWANFSLFCLATLHHGIHIKLLNSIKAKWTHQKEGTPPKQPSKPLQEYKLKSWRASLLYWEPP